MAKGSAEKATRLQQHYEKVVRKKLQEKFNYVNPMQVPKLVKISVNMGVGDGVNDSKTVTAAAEELKQITGQKAVITLAKKSEATFKLRAGIPIGAKVTLRGNRMFEFLDRFVNIALPRVRDFRGLNPKSFDGQGNYSLGLKEQIVFPELNFDRIEKLRGMDITFVTTAKTDDEARELLAAFNFPFKK